MRHSRSKPEEFDKPLKPFFTQKPDQNENYDIIAQKCFPQSQAKHNCYTYKTGTTIHCSTVLSAFFFLTLVISLLLMGPVVGAIDCFKCVSLNGNNPSCEDPFHNNFSSTILESPCMGGRKGRNGLFPATACIKLIGTFHDTRQTIVVRGCALDSGTLTTDTEIIRMSHCGGFELDTRYVKGCLQSCADADGCNVGISMHFSTLLITLTIILNLKLILDSS